MTTTYIIIAVLLAIVAILFMKSRNPEGESFNNISVVNLKPLLKDKNTILIDVRTPKEISQGKIKSALEIELGPGMKSTLGKLEKDKKYIVYCRSGRRSLLVSKMMVDMGFTDVNNLLGGYNAWK